MEKERELTSIEYQIIKEIKEFDDSPLKQISAEINAKNIILNKKLEKPYSSIGSLFLNKIEGQSATSVKLGISQSEIIRLTSGFEIDNEKMLEVMNEYGITQDDIDNIINLEYKKHEDYVNALISTFEKYDYKEISKENLLIDKSEFGFNEYSIKYYQSINDFQKLMNELFFDLKTKSDDEYSLNYYPDYAEKESLMWTLLRKFAFLSYEQIIEQSENKINKYQLATLECPYETKYDDNSIDRQLYFNILKNNFPSYLKTFKLIEYTESSKKAIFINVPIFRKDSDKLLNHTERMYCEDALIDGEEMCLARIAFIKK